MCFTLMLNCAGAPFFNALIESFAKADEFMAKALTEGSRGYIVYNDSGIFDEFHPILFRQHAGKKHKEFASFNQAVDEYFSHFDSQRLEMKARNQEATFMKKLESFKQEHAGRIEGLERAQEELFRKAGLIEANIVLVDKAIGVIQR